MPAQPETYAIASGEPLGAGRFVAPEWAPVAGEIKQIGYAAGHFGTNGGATMAEISPSYQNWNQSAPSLGVFGGYNPNNGGVAYSWGSITGYCGSSFNSDTRQIVNYSAGHASANVCAPFAFDLNELRWKWLDVPLPFDAYAFLYFNGIDPSQSNVEEHYPIDQLSFDWGEVIGDWAGWGASSRPGVIQPVPGHSRGGLVHIPKSVMGNAKGGLFSCISATGILSGLYSKQSHIFDYDTARWARTSQMFPVAAGLGHWKAGCFDPVSEKVVLMGSCSPSNPLHVFDPVAGTYTARYPANSVESCTDLGSLIAHTASGLIIMPAARNASGASAGGVDGVTFAFIAAPADTIVGAGAFSFTTLDVAVTGGWPLNSSGLNLAIGWSYCPVDQCLYAINGEGGSNKYWRLSPPSNATTAGEYLAGTWTLDEITFAVGSNAGSGRSWVYNRLSWDKKSRSFVFYGNVNDPVQAFRPEGV